MNDPLKKYKSKRNFAITPEPKEGGDSGDELAFVIQKHWASRLHYDLRLELDGTMKSWAVPKGPSYDQHDKRMAVHVEDHPISYNTFEGTIPEKEYGAGKVIIWDSGTWHPIGDPREGYATGNLKFEIRGHKMHGKWALIKIKNPNSKQDAWLLIKEKDEFVRPAAEFSVVDEMPDSVKGIEHRKAPARTKTSLTKAAAGKVPSSKKSKAKTEVLASLDVGTKSPLPPTFVPQLATLVDAAPASPEDWSYELKYDGYRILARNDGKTVKLFTRNGNDWTAKLTKLRDELIATALPKGWYDGEIVVNNEHGRPDFGLLQLAFDEQSTADIVYYIFDAPFFNGYDIRTVPLEQRRELLKDLLADSESNSVRFSATVDAPADELITAACKLGLEGIIGKRRDSAYVSRRSPDWIKLKCGLRQEFVIGGYTDPKGSRTGLGSLLLGVYEEDGSLRYAGSVGSGFTEKSLKDLFGKLTKLATDVCPFAQGKAIDKKAHWVKPELVAEVTFGEWTRSGSIRHSVFQGLRADKKARGISREKPEHPETEPDAPATKPTLRRTKKSVMPTPAIDEVESKLPSSLKVTNPERIIDAATGTTKMGLVRYYALVGSMMIEHLKGRPVSLVRAPAGVGGELFFQKHADLKRLPGLKAFPQSIAPDHPPMLEVPTVEGLLSAAQWNVVEFHTQNAFGKNYEKPNRMVFDLDPGKGITWEQIQEAALIVKAFLEQLGLPSFLKTSGGKGLHLVVPLKPNFEWDVVKGFSQAIVQHLAKTLPERFSAKSGANNREGKIFIDYLRNGRGATTACAWSARARPGLGISVPVEWEELPKLNGGDHWSVQTIHERLDVGNEPWKEISKSAIALVKPMKALGFTP